MGANTIPLMVNSATQNEAAFQGGFQNATSLQALINQTRLQAQQQQQNQQQLQLGQQQIAQQTIATQQAQQQQQDIQKFNQAFHDSNGDWNQTIANAPKAGVSPLFVQQAQMNRLGLLNSMQGYSKGQLDLEGQKADALGKAAYTIQQADPADRPTIAAQQLNQLKMQPAFANGGLPDTAPTDDATLQSLIAHSKATQDLIKEAQDNKKSVAEQPALQVGENVKQQQAVATQLANAPGDASWQSVLKNAKQQGVSDDVLAQFDPHYSPEAATRAKTMAVSPEAAAKLPVENLELASYMRQNPGKTPADFATWKANQSAMSQLNALRSLGIGTTPGAGQPGGQGGPPLTPAQKMGNVTGFTPAALDQAAQSYLTTGQLPQGARGGVAGIAQNRAIMNRAAELDPSASIMGNKQTYQANTDSLKKLQTNFDQVNAFENTALKNLDQVAQAGAAVPDLSARFANVPVRMLNSQVIGTPEMARFRTALLTAQTEAAKVLSSSNASGVLSDSARHEAQDILDGNLPFPAMMASINQLKTDFGNRHQSYQDQINDIQGRMRGAAPQNGAGAQGGGAGGAQHVAGGQAQGLTEGATGKGSDGKKYVVKGGVWVPAP